MWPCPLYYQTSSKKRTAGQRAMKYLDQVGLKGVVATHLPSELSGGQNQRVAIASAMACRAKSTSCR